MAKKFLSGLTVCLCVIFAATVQAACPSGSSQSGDYCYTQYNGEVTITNYQGSGGNVVIPGTIAGMPVVSIRKFAYQNNTSLTGVIMPDSVISIGDNAFSYCKNLTSVTIGKSVISIGSQRWHAFEGCWNLTDITVDADNPFYSSLDGVIYNKDRTTLVLCPEGRSRALIIPEGTTSIENYAFASCSSLTSVTLPDSLISIGWFAFYWCTKITSITIPDSVTSIGYDAFQACWNLTTATIGNNVTIIGDSAFQGSGLTSAHIPASVTSIGDSAFAGSNLTDITVDANNAVYSSYDGVVYNRDTTVLAIYPSGRSGEFIIPFGVTSIGDYAVVDCALTSVTIPDSVITIGNYAFEACPYLTSVTIPDSVTSIGDNAFSWCERLSVAYFLGDAPTMGDYVFDSSAPDFNICYTEVATGFTTPVWAPTPYDSYPAADCACSYDSDCEDDDLYCTGAPVCDGGMCRFASSPCNGNSPVCDEGLDTCVTAHGLVDTGDPNERACNPRSYTDLGNGIVRDNVTRLEWVQDGNLIATRNPDFDNDETEVDGAVTWQHAAEYIDLLNAEEYLGHSDWRLPTIEELSSLVDSGRYAPAIDPIFSNTVATDYWSSTPSASDTGSAWPVDFNSGNGSYTIEEHSFYVRAVRAGQSVPLDNFVINGDGTVTDIATGLMWQQCTYGQIWDGNSCTGQADEQPWDEALAYIQGLNDTDYLDYDDWRLPTRNELQSLVDYSLYMPATTFPNMGEDPYSVFNFWSSTADAYDTMDAWVLYFYDGYMSSEEKNYNYGVRAVRSGPCRADGDWCIDESDCDDAGFCNGAEMCADGVCVTGSSPCWGDTPACDENSDVCVECLVNDDCSDGFECINGVCVPVAVDNPPAITDGPFVMGSWQVLPTLQAQATLLSQNTDLLWAFSDDFVSCSGACTHTAEYKNDVDSTWKALTVSTDAGQGTAWTTLPVAQLQNGTYAFRFTVTDCAGQTTQSGTYYFKVSRVDQPPAFETGALWVGPWWELSSDPANPDKPKSQHVLFWAYNDDRKSCSGAVVNRWMYRPVALQSGQAVPIGDWVVKVPWVYLNYVWIETPGISDITGPGLFEFKMTATDCMGQTTDSEIFFGKRYYFKVE